jgi:hypothetical protein
MVAGYFLLPPFLRQAEKVSQSMDDFRSWEAAMQHRAEKIDLPAYFAKLLSKSALTQGQGDHF